MKTTTPWWATHFDAQYLHEYEPLFNLVQDRREVSRLLDVLELPSGARILDCPCGQGRHAHLLAEAGFDVDGWNGILAPAGTPKPVIERLHREITKIVRSPEFSQQLTGEGATAVGNTPAEFAALIQADIRKWAEVVKDAGIQRE